ncbi:Ig-like domain-containing protein [uncultured Methanobrevibacter sp.]|uniref:Ig-like domain-containing protein n=1 Tax=uncultured Methanobrevibacter sp. TaxID=253161 RepID=UPI00260D982A|nr:Ig-like domain-containing protein [uncultured Methanobrevibacter sp.]
MIYKNDSQYSFTVYGKDGKLAANQEVTFNINGVFYKRISDDNGIVTLKINLNPGSYIITAEYEGCRVSNNITVKSTLLTQDLTMNHKDGSTFNATALDEQGNPLAGQTITFNVNGVFYNKVTDENGIASLNINLNKGEYIITSIWNDYQVGNKITIV